jgi:hypothetical protein
MGVGFVMDENLSKGPTHAPTTFVGHTGGWPGFSTNMFLLPNHKMGFILCTNTFGGKSSYEKLTAGLVDTLLTETGASARPQTQATQHKLPHKISEMYKLDSPSMVERLQFFFSVGRRVHVKLTPNGEPQVWSRWGLFAKVERTELEVLSNDEMLLWVFLKDTPVPTRILIRRIGEQFEAFIGLHKFKRAEPWWDFLYDLLPL